MATNPKLNVDRLEAIYTWAEAHPEEWNQAHWGYILGPDCGTTMCAAGTTVVQAGYKLIFDGNRYAEAEVCKKPYGQEWDICDKAQQLLGLNMTERDLLFFNTPTRLDALRASIDSIKAGHYR